ncbi:hypothetical protein D3C87_1699460 [compost metagenome]
MNGDNTSRLALLCANVVVALGALVFQSEMPSWCFEVITAYFAPLSLIRFTHAAGSYFEALKPSSCFMYRLWGV